MFVCQTVTKLTSDNACKVWKKRVFVVPLQSISKTNLLLPLVAKSKLSKLINGDMVNNNINNINQQHIAPKTTHWALKGKHKVSTGI